MNRLIIIGNGFDLAHGLKTSFKDFIANYFYKVLLEFKKKYHYHDVLLTVKNLEGNIVIETLRASTDPIGYIQYLRNSKKIDLQIHSIFFDRVFNKVTTLNWVDIEVEFYKTLVYYKKNRGQIDPLNHQFTYLKYHLFDYLKEQEIKFKEGMISKRIMDLFTGPINYKEMITDKEYEGQIPNKYYVLNFNYTNICEKYINKLKGDYNISINYIHGGLDGVNGNPIFGFGDEFDNSYKEIEDLNDNKYFKHIKSFEYSKNQNYYELIRFTELEEFQVQIYGHSCGISDRTMLNSIFEHDHCKSIKVYYYGEDGDGDDFEDKIYNISRHFKDKTLLRKKVVPLDLCLPMPQPIEEYKAKVNGQS